MKTQLLQSLKLILLIFSCNLSFENINAQNRAANVWCFGYNNELDFNTGSPVSVGGSACGSMEGTASISDANTGRLLFSTDGAYIYDSTNTLMPNGIIQTPSFGGSSMAAIIFPKPGTNNEFYMFATPQTVGGGLHYTIIDMNLHGGLGDVTQAPQVLDSPMCDKITGARMANDSGYWVVAHIYNSDAFYAYPVTYSGIGLPVISHQGAIDSGLTHMKISPNGTKIASVVRKHKMEVFNFDNFSGTVSSPYFIDSNLASGTPSGSTYGVSFSPNSKLLYVGIGFDSTIFQYDLVSGIADTILASKYRIITSYSSGNGSSPTAMQIGPDLKIYVGIFNSHILDVINNPNNYRVGCTYQKGAIPLGNYCMMGLPNFMDWYFVSDSFLPLQAHAHLTSSPCGLPCSGTATASVFYGHPPYTYNWQPGNIASSALDSLCDGTYYVTVTDVNGTSIVDSVVVNILPPASASITQNSDTLLASASASYQWYLNGNPIGGANQQTYIATQGGSYSVAVTDTNGCSAVSTPVIISDLSPTLSFAEGVEISPNPSNSSWNLEVETALLGGSIEIFDAQGKLLLMSNIEHRITNIGLNAARGVYVLRVSSAKGSITRKLVKL